MNVDRVPPRLFSDRVSTVEVHLTNGVSKVGTTSRFDPNDEEHVVRIAFSRADGGVSNLDLELATEDVVCFAFHRAVSLVEKKLTGKMREYGVYTAGGGRYTVGADPDTVGHPRGFYGYPLAIQSVIKEYFFFSHAVTRLEDKEPLGSLMIREGVVDAAAIDQGLRHQAAVSQAPPLGQILIDKNIVQPDQIDDAAKMQVALARQGRPMRLGEILVESGLATEEDIQAALNEQKQHKGKRLGEVLVDLGIVKETDVARTLAKKFQLPFVDLDEVALNDKAIGEIPIRLIEKYRIFPFDTNEQEIRIAISDPLAMEPLDMLRFSLSKRIVEVMVAPSQLDSYIKTYVGEDDRGKVPEVKMHDILAELKVGSPAPAQEAGLKDIVEAKVEDSAIAKLVNRIMVDAYRREASDIHIEPYGTGADTVIRFRIDGVCTEYQKIPSVNRRQLIARIKIMANLDITERRRPQDGKIRFRIGNRTVELRVATVPTVDDNEDAVLRILAGGSAMPLGEMNLSEYNISNLQRLVARPYGILLAVGPTGSGKTTTLHALVGQINDESRKIWTAEDPVEITQYGLRQVQVNPAIGFTFARAMRAFLRADPDVILVGEMRDRETALIGVEASLTGHLVLSTLHTNSAAETVTRLIEMGVDHFSFADAILGVIAQRLSRKLCGKCRSQYPASEEEVQELEHYYGVEALRERLQGEPLQLWSASGCDACGRTGYKGRIGIHELLVASDEVRAAIRNNAKSNQILAVAREQGMATLLEDGFEKCLAGLTDIKSVLSVCGR